MPIYKFDCTVSPHQSVWLHDALVKAGANVGLTLYDGVGHGGKFWQSPEVKAKTVQFFDINLRKDD